LESFASAVVADQHVFSRARPTRGRTPAGEELIDFRGPLAGAGVFEESEDLVGRGKAADEIEGETPEEFGIVRRPCGGNLRLGPDLGDLLVDEGAAGEGGLGLLGLGVRGCRPGAQALGRPDAWIPPSNGYP
jgi:hypothetical protein